MIHSSTSCYDTLDNQFLCQLERIECVFADLVYSDYLRIKYGIEDKCRRLPSFAVVSDLRELMEYSNTLSTSEFAHNTYRNSLTQNANLLTQAGDGCISDFLVESLHICSISSLVERINSLF